MGSMKRAICPYLASPQLHVPGLSGKRAYSIVDTGRLVQEESLITNRAKRKWPSGYPDQHSAMRGHNSPVRTSFPA
jgi:hypothetical protein